jgi:Na+/pantothenate symporter
MNTALANVDPNLVSTFTGIGSVIAVVGNAAVWGIGNSSHPVFLGQAYASKSTKTILKSMAVSSVVIFLFYLSAMILGAGSRILVTGLEDPDFAFPTLVQRQLPPAAAAILLTAVVSLVISTVASVLFTAGTAMGNDLLIKTFGVKADEKQRLLIIRLAIVCVSFLGMLLAMLRPTQVLIFQMLNFGASGAIFFVPILFGLYWKRANRPGGIAAMIGGLGVYIVWYVCGQPFGIHPVITGTLTATVLMMIVSLSTPPPSEAIIGQYFPDSPKASAFLGKE